MSAIVERRTRKRYKAAAASGLVAAVYGAVSWADTLPVLSATIWMTIIFSPAVMGLIAVIRIAPNVGEFVDDEDYVSPTGIFFDGQDLNATNRQRQSTFTQQHWQSRDTVMIVIDARQVEELMQRLRDIERARTTDAENIKRLELYHAMLQPVVTRLEQRQQRQDENIHELAKRTQALESENNEALVS